MKKLRMGLKDYWENISDERLKEVIKKASKTRESNCYYHSSLEVRFCSILESLNISFTRQYHINKNRHPYDFHLCDSKIIIEINGNFWHANPLYYQDNDIIKYPGGKKTAKEVWERDKKFIDWAEKNGYKVIVIWEDDFKKTDDELKDLFLNMLNNL
jgi:G:T-mismatch repair DNA endonuclease (very short patch repair protein)